MSKNRNLPLITAERPSHARFRSLSNSSPSEGSDWCRITNSSDGSSADVFIYDEIGFWGTDASTFVKDLRNLKTDTINLHLNSPGGEVFDAVAIYNALKAHPAAVNVQIDGLAASAASFIAQAGDTITMSRGSTMMIHDALAVCIGNEKDMTDTATVLSKISNNIADIYAVRAGGTVDEWRSLMREEVWFNAQEAVDAGLADSVDGEAQSTQNRWDLSIFNYAGREAAPSPAAARLMALTNTAFKEAAVQPKNTEPVEPAQPEAAPEAQPEETSTEAAPEVTEAAPEEQPEVPAADDGAPGEGEEPTPAPEEDEIVNRKGSALTFTINGVKTRSATAVQAHINRLEAAAKETKDGFRKDFVKNLCDGNKITAAQAEGLETFALSLSDEQYAVWTASWDAAPSLGVLAKVAAGTTNHDGDTNLQASAEKQRIEDAVEIVKQHKLSNMPQDKIEKTASWAVLVAANATDRV